MNNEEYNKVKSMDYLEYCDYLQEKYGIGLADYMTKSFYKNKKVTRTKEGLFCHHIYEDKTINLSTRELAMFSPLEWQKKENLVYCDYLEHLLLHTLITISPDKKNNNCGIGGIYIIAQELNDLYSGMKTKQEWKKNCFSKVKKDKDVYLTILEQFISVKHEDNYFRSEELLSSSAAPFGVWDINNNKEIFDEISDIIKKYDDSFDAEETNKKTEEDIEWQADSIKQRKERRKNKDAVMEDKLRMEVRLFMARYGEFE